MATEIHILNTNNDNYCYVLASGNEAVVVDACSAKPIYQILNKYRLTLRMILSTHHHMDHTGGNTALAASTGCVIIGGDSRIRGINQYCSDGESLATCVGRCECIAVPGHSAGSYAYYFPDHAALFTGDSLFYAGCGRIFDGSAAQLFYSLMRLTTYPDTTRIYCGHEYTLDNLAFALTIEPDNHVIGERIAIVKEELRMSMVYGPSTIVLEKTTNPFLRCHRPGVMSSMGFPAATTPVTVFETLRRKKDLF